MLKDMDEFNAERKSARAEMNSNEPRANGIACPKCGAELFDSRPMFTLASYPAQKEVHCACGYHGYRVA